MMRFQILIQTNGQKIRIFYLLPISILEIYQPILQTFFCKYKRCTNSRNFYLFICMDKLFHVTFSTIDVTVQIISRTSFWRKYFPSNNVGILNPMLRTGSYFGCPCSCFALNSRYWLRSKTICKTFVTKSYFFFVHAMYICKTSKILQLTFFFNLIVWWHCLPWTSLISPIWSSPTWRLPQLDCYCWRLSWNTDKNVYLRTSSQRYYYKTKMNVTMAPPNKASTALLYKL